MSTRPYIAPNLQKPLVNGVSMTSQVISTPTDIQNIPGISYDIAWTGTPVGTFAVQVSNTYAQNPDGSTQVAGNWNTLPTSAFTGTYPVPNGSAGNGFLDVVGTEAKWVRIVYNPGSSTGTLTIVPSAKVL